MTSGWTEEACRQRSRQRHGMWQSEGPENPAVLFSSGHLVPKERRWLDSQFGKDGLIWQDEKVY